MADVPLAALLGHAWTRVARDDDRDMPWDYNGRWAHCSGKYTVHHRGPGRYHVYAHSRKGYRELGIRSKLRQAQALAERFHAYAPPEGAT